MKTNISFIMAFMMIAITASLSSCRIPDPTYDASQIKKYTDRIMQWDIRVMGNDTQFRQNGCEFIKDTLPYALYDHKPGTNMVKPVFVTDTVFTLTPDWETFKIERKTYDYDDYSFKVKYRIVEKI